MPRGRGANGEDRHDAELEPIDGEDARPLLRLGEERISDRVLPSSTRRREQVETDDTRTIGSWVGITVVSVLVAFVLVRPANCTSDADCARMVSAPWNPFSSYAVCALTTALSMEASSLRLTWRSAQPLVGMVRGIEYTFVPPALLCLAFIVLIFENVCIGTLNLVHACAPGVGGTTGRPMYSAIYAEWLVTVPILLALSGKFALQRSFSQVSRPLVMTNVYIIMSWAAHFVPPAPWGWGLITISLIMYMWASIDMIVWVRDFRASTRYDLPARDIRCAMAFGLILVFFAYGVVYLASYFGMISSHTELMSFVTMNVVAKLGMLVLFVGIRSSQFFDLLVDLLVNKSMPFTRQRVVEGNPGDSEPPSTLPIVH